MLRPYPTLAAAAGALAALAACRAPEHTNRFDPQTPAELQAKATLRGTVTLEAVGTTAPVLADVTISVTGSGAGGSTTDVDGAWVLGGVSPGTYTVRATRSGYADGYSGGVLVTLDDGDQDVIVPPIALAVARGELAGRIALEGEPSAAGVSVSIAGVPDASSAAETWTAATATDGDGRFRLTRVPVGTYALTATRAGFHPGTVALVTVAGGVGTEIADLQLAANAGSISGTVRLEGAADGAGVLVTATGTTLAGTPVQVQQTTLGDGAFLLSAPAGSYAVALSRDGWEAARSLVAVGPGEPVALGTATLALSRGIVAGTVTLSAGAASGFPVGADFSGIVVTLSGVSPTLSGVTDASGGYRLDGVPVSPSGAAYTLTARKASYQARETTVNALGNATVTAPALSLPVDAGALAGTVLLHDAAGGGGDNAVHAGTTVSLTGTAFNGSSWSASTTTASTGAFTLGNLPPGSYDVAATSANRTCAAFGPATVEPGATATAATVRCVDALAPTAVALGAPQPSAGGQPGFVAGTSVTVPIATPASDATAPASNFRGYQIVVGSAADWSAAAVVAGQPGSLGFSGVAPNATNTLWARAVDWIGNAGPVASVQVVSDTTPPPAPAMATPRTFVDATTTSVTLSGSETDANFAGYESCSYAQPAGASCAATPPGGCAWTVTAAAFAVSLSANQRTCVFARAYDRAGNRSGTSSLGAAGVVSDLLPPTPPTLAPSYDPTLLTVRAPWVDLFVAAASTDQPAGGAAWQDVAWLEVDVGAGFQPLCASAACRPGGAWAPCGCGCADPRLLCDGARLVGIRAPLVQGTRNTVAVRAVDLAGNVGPGVSQQVEADSIGDIVAGAGSIEGDPIVRGNLVGYSDWVQGSNQAGMLLDLGSNRRVDATDRRCAVSTYAPTGYDTPVVPASSSLVVASNVIDLRTVRPGADGLFCTGDDVTVPFRTPPSGYYVDGVSGWGERIAWWERKNAPGAIANLYVREAGADGLVGTADDPAPALFGFGYVDRLTMGEKAILVKEAACGDSCYSWVWRLINPNASGSWSSGTTTLDLAGVASAALSVDGRRVAWLEAGPLLRVRDSGPNGRFDASDDTVATVAIPSSWGVGTYAPLAVDGPHVVVLANGSPVSWLVHVWAGPDGAFGTSDDVVERTQASGGTRAEPSLADAYLAFSAGNDVLGLDLSALRWEVAPAAGLDTTHPLDVDGRGWLFYKPSGQAAVARSPAGAERSAPFWTGVFAVDGKQLVHLSDSGALVQLRVPDASGAWFSATAPAPVDLYAPGTNTVDRVAIGGGKALVQDYAWSAARNTNVAHYRVLEPGAGTLSTFASTGSVVDILPDGVREGWAWNLAITRDQVFFPCHDWATASLYLCVHGAGPDHVFGTADDPRPATFASAVKLLHPAGSPRAGLPVADARALRVSGGRMILSEFSPGAIYLFDAGPDGLFNTADDRGRKLADITAYSSDVGVAGDWAAFLASGPPAGEQLYLVHGLDGPPTPVTSHYSAKSSPTLEPSGRAFWSDFVFVPEAVFVRAP